MNKSVRYIAIPVIAIILAGAVTSMSHAENSSKTVVAQNTTPQPMSRNNSPLPKGKSYDVTCHVFLKEDLDRTDNLNGEQLVEYVFSLRDTLDNMTPLQRYERHKQMQAHFKSLSPDQQAAYNIRRQSFSKRLNDAEHAMWESMTPEQQKKFNAEYSAKHKDDNQKSREAMGKMTPADQKKFMEYITNDRSVCVKAWQ